MSPTCRECGAGEGHMGDLIGRLVASSGDCAAAERAVTVIPPPPLRQRLSRPCALRRRAPYADAETPMSRFGTRSTLCVMAGLTGRSRSTTVMLDTVHSQLVTRVAMRVAPEIV